MARPGYEILSVLQKTADHLQHSSSYQWGHMGLCNCGFLAQQISHLKKEEIHRRAMQRHGDWTEQLNDYCATSGLPMDDLISEMLSIGFDTDDLRHLERLSSPVVLRRMAPQNRNLKHNVKEDVVKYLRVWAELIESQLLAEIALPEFEPIKKVDVFSPEV